MPRSAKVHPDQLNYVKLAYTRKGYFTQKALAQKLNLAQSTVNNFFRGLNVSISTIETLCKALDLDTRVVIQFEPDAQFTFNRLFQQAHRSDHRIRLERLAPEQDRPKGLGLPPSQEPESPPVFQLNDWVTVSIWCQDPYHLLLLNQDAAGDIYCLCPSLFVRDTQLQPGWNRLPTAFHPFNAFQLKGSYGVERLLAILSTEPLPISWIHPLPLPLTPQMPAHLVTPEELEDLAQYLHYPRDPRPSTLLATSFRVTA